MHLMHITDQSYTRDNFCQNNVIRRSASHRRWNSRLEHRRLAGWLCPELPPFCTNLPNWQNGKYQTFWDHLPFYRANFLQNKFNKKRSYFTFRPFLYVHILHFDLFCAPGAHLLSNGRFLFRKISWNSTSEISSTRTTILYINFATIYVVAKRHCHCGEITYW